MVWLLFVVGVLLNLVSQWFDVKSAIMTEKPTLNVYVTMDGLIYKLVDSLFGLDYAAKLFNDHLVEHPRLVATCKPNGISASTLSGLASPTSSISTCTLMTSLRCVSISRS